MPDDSKRSMTDAERAVRKVRDGLMAIRITLVNGGEPRRGTFTDRVNNLIAAAEWRALEDALNYPPGSSMMIYVHHKMREARRRYEEASK